jgi:hypothetical protein
MALNSTGNPLYEGSISVENGANPAQQAKKQGQTIKPNPLIFN